MNPIFKDVNNFIVYIIITCICILFIDAIVCLAGKLHCYLLFLLEIENKDKTACSVHYCSSF